MRQEFSDPAVGLAGQASEDLTNSLYRLRKTASDTWPTAPKRCSYPSEPPLLCSAFRAGFPPRAGGRRSTKKLGGLKPSE